MAVAVLLAVVSQPCEVFISHARLSHLLASIGIGDSLASLGYGASIFPWDVHLFDSSLAFPWPSAITYRTLRQS